jgi:hypothetical protein
MRAEAQASHPFAQTDRIRDGAKFLLPLTLDLRGGWGVPAQRLVRGRCDWESDDKGGGQCKKSSDGHCESREGLWLN